jgi:hypothetical protein
VWQYERAPLTLGERTKARLTSKMVGDLSPVHRWSSLLASLDGVLVTIRHSLSARLRTPTYDQTG